MKYFLLAGETSGDLHGSNLIHALKRKSPNASFHFIGGNKMQVALNGQKPLIHVSQLAVMGFLEVLKHIFFIHRAMKLAKKDIIGFQPNALILIDFPGFNLQIAKFAKKKGISVFYYIPPKVWAWNTKRIFKIKQSVNHLFCIFPFEKEFYEQRGMPVNYVGNPLLDAIQQHKPNEEVKEIIHANGKKTIALLPGSRKQEISRLLPIMEQVVIMMPAYQFVIAGAPGFDAQFYQAYLKKVSLPILFDATYDLLLCSEAAIVASGTATLEAALLNLPQVVIYKINPLTAYIAKRLIKLKYVSLVNIILNQEAVKELLQAKCKAINIAKELDKLLNVSPYRKTLLDNYKILQEKLGGPGASQRTADLIWENVSTLIVKN